MSERRIFRESALRRGSSQWLGSVRIATPVSHAMWAISMTMLGVIVLCFLYFGEYTRREKVMGQLVLRDGTVRITSTTTGYVSRVRLSEGENASIGLPVLDVDNESYSTESIGVKQGVSIALQDEVKAIQSDMKVSRETAASSINSIKQQLPLLEARLAGATAELDVYKKEEQEQQDFLLKTESLLTSGYISATQIQQQRSTLAAVSANVRRQLSEVSNIRIEEAKLRAELEKAPLDLAAKLNVSERLLANANAESRTNAGERNITLHSPIEGVVSSVLVNEGQFVKPGQTLMTIVKNSAQIEAQLLVGSQSIGFIEPGTKVALRLRAFPSEKFGVVMGSIKTRSLTPLTPEEATNRLGISAVNESMFLVRVTLREQSIDIYGRDVKLTPGMYVDANILLDRRKIYEWMFQPAYTLKMKGA